MLSMFSLLWLLTWVNTSCYGRDRYLWYPCICHGKILKAHVRKWNTRPRFSSHAIAYREVLDWCVYTSLYFGYVSCLSLPSGKLLTLYLHLWIDPKVRILVMKPIRIKRKVPATNLSAWVVTRQLYLACNLATPMDLQIVHKQYKLVWLD